MTPVPTWDGLPQEWSTLKLWTLAVAIGAATGGALVGLAEWVVRMEGWGS